jgi:hypothetical protein
MLAQCKRKEVTFTALGIHESFLVTMHKTGYNEIKYFYYDGIKKISRLMNFRKPEFSKENFTNIDDYNRYFLRINYLDTFYTLRFKSPHDFIMLIKGIKRKYHIKNFLTILLSLEKHISFSPVNIVSVKMFDNRIRRDTNIPVTGIEKLLNIINHTRDIFILKSKHETTPELILNIEKVNGSFQLFCADDSVWVNGKTGIYLYKNKRIKNALDEIKKIRS